MGYNTKKVNVDWWVSQLDQGKKFRKEVALEDMWDTWRAYYRGWWDADILPVNFFFMILRSLVPRVYFKNPAVSVTPAKPGLANAAFAQVLGRIDNKLIHNKSMNVKNELKRMIQDAFMFGRAFGKLGFGAEFTPALLSDGNIAPVGRRYGRLEYTTGIQRNQPWFKRVHPRDIIVPDGLGVYRETPWVAHQIIRPIEDVIRDKRLSNTQNLKSDMYMYRTEDPGSRRRRHDPVEAVTLYEIRDKKFDRVLILSEYSDKPHYEGADSLTFQGDIPIYTFSFNPDDEYFWSVPDANILDPQQREANETRTQMMTHRRLTVIKFLYEKGAIDINEINKIKSQEIMAAVQVNNLNKLQFIKSASIPPELQTHLDTVHGDVRETIGFSRNQMGETMPSSDRTTATEAQIVQMANEIRVDERRDIVADTLMDIVHGMNNIIFSQWEGEHIVDIIGPGGIPLWVQFTPEMLRGGAYEVKIDPDHAMPETRIAREQKAVQVYSLFKDNPLIEPVKLTAYLLRELHGVEYDDLMRGLPDGSGLVQPMQMEQYIQMLANANRMALQQPQQGQIPQQTGGGR